MRFPRDAGMGDRGADGSHERSPDDACPRKYPLELRERAVRMYRASEPKPVIRRMTEELGVHHEALRNWIRQAEADAGERGDMLTTAEREKLAPCARRMPSSSGRTRSCGRPRLFSRPSSTRPGPGDRARRCAPAPGGRARTPGTVHPLLDLLPMAPGRDRAVRATPPGCRADGENLAGSRRFRRDLRHSPRARRPAA